MWKSLLGLLDFEIVGGQGERLLNWCAQQGIAVQHIVPTETGFAAQLPLRSYLRLHKTARKYRCRLRVTQKRGLYFCARAYRHRWGILLGAVLAVLLLLVFSRLIWTVRFYNFTPAEEKSLRAQLYAKGIEEGALVSTEDLIYTQAQLFCENAQYGWVKLNFVFGKLVVEKVNSVSPPSTTQDESITNVVALCDGIIERVEARGGYVRKKEGQSVAEGEILVSGLSAGPVTGVIFTRHAEAKVYAQVERIYEIKLPYAVTVQAPQSQTVSAYALCTFGAEVPLGFAPEPLGQSEGTVLRYPLKVLGLPLPATVKQTQYRLTRPVTQTRTPEQTLLAARAQLYSAMAAGLPECKLRSVQETVREENDGIFLRMKITASANIAKTVPFGR